MAGPVGRRQGYNCNLGTRAFWGQAQLEGNRATTAIWELEIFAGMPSWKATGLQLQSGNSRFFGGRPSWKATGLQLQSGNSRFFGGGPSRKATGLQLQSGNSRFFGGKPSWKATGLQLQSGNSRFLVIGPVGRRQGYNCNLGTRDFLVAGPVGRRQGYNCNLGTRDFFGGRSSWKATGLQLQSGNLKFSWRQAQSEGDKATTTIWELEIFRAAGPVRRPQGYNYPFFLKNSWRQAKHGARGAVDHVV